MSRVVFAALLVTVLTFGIEGQNRGTPQSGDTAFYTVSYTELMPSGRSEGLAVFREYLTAMRTLDGYRRFELFEQRGRPGHFAVIETWRDREPFDARGAGAVQRLIAGLEKIRISDYDQRPYKTLTLGETSGTPDRLTVYVITHVDVSQSPQVPILLQRLADASRKESGNLRFDVLQHTMRANHFTVIEGWKDQAGLDRHVEAAHTRQYRAELAPFTGSPLDERLYELVE